MTKKLLKIPKGYKSVCFPIAFPPLAGETSKDLKDFIKKHKLPKKYTLTYERTINMDNGWMIYDNTQIEFEK